MSIATQVVAPRMQALQKLEKSLKRLDLSWKVIETTARVVSPPDSVGFIATLEHTRSAFGQLAREMLEQLAQTHLTNAQHDLAARAQVAIDILVRNLFERTADVGFIATDAPLVSFVQAPTDHARDLLQARLTEYRNKYTVYDDILVLDASTRCLLSLNGTSPLQGHAPEWWDQVVDQHGYVEAFGPSPLFKGMGNVLLYAHRITSTAGTVCGVVVLKFDLKSELVSIFKALKTPQHHIVLLDDHSRIVASSDSAFAANESLQLSATSATAGVIKHRGVDYLFAHCLTRGYQGYGGPGWAGVALARIDEAFDGTTEVATRGGASHAASDIDIELNNVELQLIVARARTIEEDLNRVIWNGKLHSSSTASETALGPVFAEIGRTSQQTIATFDGAILALKHLLVQGRRAELAAHAALAVDIMDRNLYERANDCRWWALSEEFVSLLCTLESGPNDEAVQRAGEMLSHLNSLYTVYRRVALFDRQGRVLAVSKDSHTLPADCAIPVELLKSTLGLKNTQAYAVSAMQPHALADGEATYLYCAPFRSAGGQQALGGIALAFNCKVELQAMLQDSLPASTAAVGVFVDRSGRVLASTHPDIAVGDLPEFAHAIRTQVADSRPTEVSHWQGRNYLLGRAQSKGYREFKTTDGYSDEVHALLLAGVDSARPAPSSFALPHVAADANCSHFGVVQCGTMLFALASSHVMEALSATELASPPPGSDIAGLLKVNLDGELSVLPVYDGCQLTHQAPMTTPCAAVAVVVRGKDRPLVLLVDRLVDVIANNHLTAPPGGIQPGTPWITGCLHDGQAHTQAVLVLDPTELVAPTWQQQAPQTQASLPLGEVYG